MKTLKTTVCALKQLGRVHRQGFTLLEMMIATVVFSVGMMAVFVLQLTSINAYTSARDITQATDSMDRFVGVLGTEIQQSIRSNSSGSLYGNNSPFLGTNLEDAILTTPWTWALMTPEPLNETFGKENGRMCVWVRGGFIPNLLGQEDNSAAAAVPVGSLDTDLRLHVAVVYPTSQRFTTTCGNIFAQCDNIQDVAEALVPEMNEDDPANPELCGLRVLHSSSIITIPIDNTEQP